MHPGRQEVALNGETAWIDRDDAIKYTEEHHRRGKGGFERYSMLDKGLVVVWARSRFEGSDQGIFEVDQGVLGRI